MNWDDAVTAARLFAVDPPGQGGVTVRAGPGPARDLWLDCLRRALPVDVPIRRCPAAIEDDRLLGGLDLATTLTAGRPVMQSGVLVEADGGIVLIAMAERLGAGVAARIASALDRHEVNIERDGICRHLPTRFGVVALDEGASSDEQIPAALAERFAFHIDLSEMSMRDLKPFAHGRVTAARASLPAIAPASEEIIAALVAAAASFAIESIVAPLLALRAARASAALAGRKHIAEEDVILAARLVLAPRARAQPQTEASGGAHAQEPQHTRGEEAELPQEETPDKDLTSLPSLEDILLAAVQASLPKGLLTTSNAGMTLRGPPARGRGSGSSQASPLRGRPAGVRAGTLKPGARLGLVETLRAAAPWQPVRRAERKARGDKTSTKIEVRREDFRVKKFVRHRESTTIFCVDASGSTAFHRLAETKGAVELLLGEAYVARNFAALVAFRGTDATVLLPPTRSLARARALLATLPGGGGTPLAEGLETALLTAIGERARGRQPLVVVLTDGQANIARDGLAARSRARDEALVAGKQFMLQHIAAVFVDTSPRPREEGANLAHAMGARYVTLPYLQAAAVCDVVRGSAQQLRVPAR